MAAAVDAKAKATAAETSTKEVVTKAETSAKKAASKAETSAKKAAIRAETSAKEVAANAETSTKKALEKTSTERAVATTDDSIKNAVTPKRKSAPAPMSPARKSLTKKKDPDSPSKKSKGSPTKEDAMKKQDSTVVQLKTTLAERHEWDVFTPPPVDSLKGHFIPEVFSRYKRRRKISLEVQHIHLPPSDDKSKEGQPNFYEEVVVRILVPINMEEEKASRRRGKDAIKSMKKRNNLNLDGSDHSKGDSIASFRASTVSVLNTRDSIKSAVGDDISVISGMGFAMDENDYLDVNGRKSNDWKPKHIMPLDGLTINKVDGNKCFATTNLAGVKHARKVLFDSKEAASEFAELVAMYKAEQKDRTDKKLKVALGGLEVKQDDKVTLLVEIVSGWNLPAADLTSSDPFVKVFLNGVSVHKTKPISNTLDPIWTLKTGSLFLLETTIKDLFMSPQGVMFQVFDYDTIGGNDSLGAAIVNPKVLYDAKGDERIELPLQKAPGQKMETSGFIAIRCRHATDYDKKFMAKFVEEGKKEVAEASAAEAKAESMAGGKSDLATLATKYVKKIDGIEKLKVRPGPDPKRKEMTTWMTEAEIENETMLDSTHWFDVGSGTLGRLFVEVLGCDGLPNLDTGVVSKNKTDAFVAAIFEDGIMKTDIIDDCLSPRWLPWSKRAFIYHIMHTSSQLFLGVFDYDGGIGNDHDLIGRVAVDVSNLRKDTTYVMKFDIFPTTATTQREAQGNITVRVRLEVDDDRKFVMGNLAPPPEVYVNVKNGKDFRVARNTLYGTYDQDAYNMKTINAYVEELLAYKNLLHHIGDAIIGLLLWRGTYYSPLLGREIKLPLHSFFAFICAVILVERPSLMPSFFFGSISWLLLAVMSWRQRNPDAWLHSKTFREMMEALVIGKPVTTGPDDIPPNHNKEEAEAYRAAWAERLARAERLAAKQADEAAKQEAEHQKELAEVGEAEEIGTSAGGISIDPMKRFLFPIQQYLAMVCKLVRIVRNVVYWEESYFAFWLTMGCFVLAIVFLFVPWIFLMRWTARIVAWVVFGPWMKAVDVFYYSKIEPLTEEEEMQKIVDNRIKAQEATSEAVKELRIQKENNLKLKDIKKFMFGKYITNIPILKQDRYKDKPLPESYAVPYKPDPLPLADLAMKEAGYNRTRLAGQHLVGTMIPRVDPKAFTDAPAGEPTARPDLLDKNSPGAKVSKDSNVVAYAKIGGIVAAAGAFTWFGVPVITSYAGAGLGYVKGLVGM